MARARKRGIGPRVMIRARRVNTHKALLSKPGPTQGQASPPEDLAHIGQQECGRMPFWSWRSRQSFTTRVYFLWEYSQIVCWIVLMFCVYTDAINITMKVDMHMFCIDTMGQCGPLSSMFPTAHQGRTNNPFKTPKNYFLLSFFSSFHYFCFFLFASYR